MTRFDEAYFKEREAEVRDVPNTKVQRELIEGLRLAVEFKWAWQMYDDGMIKKVVARLDALEGK